MDVVADAEDTGVVLVEIVVGLLVLLLLDTLEAVGMATGAAEVLGAAEPVALVPDVGVEESFSESGLIEED